ncbi:unnamed protein product, partial [marine sediment metagenome]
MEEKNILERLVEVSPGMEIWWDSSPLIYDIWCEEMLNKATSDDAKIMERQFERMYNPKDPASQLFRGVTTNPGLSLQAIKSDEGFWNKIVKDLIKNNPGINKESLFWLMYKQVVKRGSEMYLPLFEKSGYKQGYLSGQVDPRSPFDKEKMLRQAYELAALNPNVMVKIPGSKE